MARKRSRSRWPVTLARQVRRLAPGVSSPEAALDTIVGALLRDVTVCPTDLDAVARCLGVPCRPVEHLASAGTLVREDDRLVITFESRASVERQRFTIAHELGHVLLDRHGLPAPQRGGDVEQFCDQFASRLLLPNPYVADAIERVSLADLRRVAKRFVTSLQATANRYAAVTGAEILYESETRSWTAGCLSAKDPVVRDAMTKAALDPQLIVSLGKTVQNPRLRRVEVEQRSGWTLALFAPVDLRR